MLYNIVGEDDARAERIRMKREPILVLHVEDNPDHAELVRRVLAEHQIVNRIEHLSDGESAMDYLFRRSEYNDPARSPRPHLILLDLRLPRIDGSEILEAVKEDKELRTIPVVILTTSVAARDFAMAYSHHANSFLVKPFGYNEFSDMIKGLSSYWLGWNRISGIVHPWFA